MRRMVAEIFQGRPDATAAESAPTENSVQELADEQNSQGVTQHAALQNPEPQNLPEASSVRDNTIVQREEENAATQHDAQHSEDDLPIKRTHGGALPQ